MSDNTRTPKELQPLLSTLELALAYLEAHPTRFLFPIEPRKKSPPKILDNLAKASNDPEQIRKWHAKWFGCNWGLSLKKSNLLVVDVDTKDGKDGAKTYATLDVTWGWPETETVRTINGGFHYYYDGVHIFALGVNGFGSGVDSPNYVLIAGCSTKDGAYEQINSLVSVPAPAWFYDEIKSKKKDKLANVGEIATDLDEPPNIAWARDYLANDAEPSIEGQGGEQQMLKVAMALRDYAISEALAVELINELYNVEPKCSPIWALDELTAKVRNGYVYANQAMIGGKTAGAEFSDEPNDFTDADVMGDREKIKAQAKARTTDKKRPPPPANADQGDFHAYLPEHKYIYGPTGHLWPLATINSILGKSAGSTLDRKKPIHIMAWCPGKPAVLVDTIVLEGGTIAKKGSNTFNTFKPPPVLADGDATQATLWVEHVNKLFPETADHIIKWLAHRVRFLDVKINHSLIMGSDKQGIGKDAMLEPIVRILGDWNCKDVTAAQSMDEKFNPHLEALFCRISEANDLGDDDRFKFYERRKAWAVSPPNTITVTDKHVKAHPVVNVVAMVVSGNEKSGFYLPPDDRRNHVNWSDCVPGDFEDGYFIALFDWYDAGGVGHVLVYLKSVDLSGFDPKAPPPKTAAFYEIVSNAQSTDASELDDLLDYLNQPFSDQRPIVVTIPQLIAAAGHRDAGGKFEDALDMLTDKRARKSLAHRLGRSGYTPVQNDGETEGRWRIGGKRVVIYGRKDVPMVDRLDAANELVKAMFVSDAEQQRKDRAARKRKTA